MNREKIENKIRTLGYDDIKIESLKNEINEIVKFHFFIKNKYDFKTDEDVDIYIKKNIDNIPDENYDENYEKIKSKNLIGQELDKFIIELQVEKSIKNMIDIVIYEEYDNLILFKKSYLKYISLFKIYYMKL